MDVNDAFKLQHDERERRIEYDPEKSEAATDYITIDPDTMSMLKELGMNSLRNITTHSAQTRYDASAALQAWICTVSTRSRRRESKAL